MDTAVVLFRLQEMWISAVLHVWKTSGGREILITAAVYICVCASWLSMWVHVHRFLCLWVCVRAYICVCMPGLCRVILIILTSQCPILGEKGVEGWGRKRVREKKGRRDVLPPWQTPFKWTTESDQWFPPGVCCIGRPTAQAFQPGNNWEYQLSLQEDYTPWVENQLFHHIYTPSLSLFSSPSSSFFFFCPVYSSCMFVCNWLSCVGSSCFVCLVSGCWIREEEPK